MYYPLTIPRASCTIGQVMKSSIHPQDYRLVVFSDEQAGFAFLTKSTAQTPETIKWEDGNEYPLVKLHISSASHPFFTGEMRFVDRQGRVDRFVQKMKMAQQLQATTKTKKTAKKQAEGDPKSYQEILREQQSELRKQEKAAATKTE